MSFPTQKVMSSACSKHASPHCDLPAPRHLIWGSSDDQLSTSTRRTRTTCRSIPMVTRVDEIARRVKSFREPWSGNERSNQQRRPRQSEKPWAKRHRQIPSGARKTLRRPERQLSALEAGLPSPSIICSAQLTQVGHPGARFPALELECALEVRQPDRRVQLPTGEHVRGRARDRWSRGGDPGHRHFG
jgi:hypothetical protein